MKKTPGGFSIQPQIECLSKGKRDIVALKAHLVLLLRGKPEVA